MDEEWTCGSNEDRCVDTLELTDLSKRLGRDWKDLGRCMELEEGTLTNIEYDNRCNGLAETALQMVLTWRERMGDTATIHALAKHLRAVQRVDLANLILSPPKTERPEHGTRIREETHEGQTVDMALLTALGRRLGTDWKNLGREMDMPDETLDAIEADHRSSGLAEMAIQLLITWQNDMSSRATAESLATHLQAIHRRDLAQLIKTSDVTCDFPRSPKVRGTLQPV